MMEEQQELVLYKESWNRWDEGGKKENSHPKRVEWTTVQFSSVVYFSSGMVDGRKNFYMTRNERVRFKNGSEQEWKQVNSSEREE